VICTIPTPDGRFGSPTSSGVPEGSDPLSGAVMREPFGARMRGPLGGEGSETMAVGDVSADVTSLEFRLADGDSLQADLIDPPVDLDIPRRFYVLTLPLGAEGEMVALNEDGQVLATERFGRDESS
jgi:hypothetical protein